MCVPSHSMAINDPYCAKKSDRWNPQHLLTISQIHKVTPAYE